MKNNLLEIKDLTVRFQSTEGLVTAVNELSLSLERGETLGIVGESGCGKTVSVLAVMGLIPDSPGKGTPCCIPGGFIKFEQNGDRHGYF